MRTFCGSLRYLAPEIFDDKIFTNAVDIWSLGVIIRKYGFGLPKEDDLHQAAKELDVQNKKKHGRRWCTAIIKGVTDLKPTVRPTVQPNSESKLIDLLRKILVEDPTRRLTAKGCLDQGIKIGLFEPNTQPQDQVGGGVGGSKGGKYCKYPANPSNFKGGEEMATGGG